MKKKLIWIGLSLLFLTMVGFGIVAVTFKMPEFGGIEAFDVEDLHGDELQGAVKVKIYNGNFFAISARKLDFFVSYHDTVIAKGALPEEFSLISSDTTHLKLPLAFSLAAIFANYQSILAHKHCPIDIHLEGEFTPFHLARGLDFSTEIEPAKLIADILFAGVGDSPLKLQELTFKSTSLTSSEIGFVSVVENPLDIPMEISELNMMFIGEGNDIRPPLGNWTLDKPVQLTPKSSVRLPGTAAITHKVAAESFFHGIFAGELKLKTTTSIVFRIADLPFKIGVTGWLTIDPKTGKTTWVPYEED